MSRFKLFLRRFSKTFKIGDKVVVERMVSSSDLKKFIELSGDDNPVHLESNDGSKAVVHGAFLNSLVSGVIGTRLPGPGTLVLSENLNFPEKCFIDERIKITVELVDNRKIAKVKFTCDIIDGDNSKTVLFGDARLIVKNKT